MAKTAQEIRLLCCDTVRTVCSLVQAEQQGMNPVQQAIDYAERHYDSRFTLSDAASMCHYSMNYFSYIFKEQTGESFVSYLNSIRLKHAVKLLRDSESSVSDIAQACGFNDINYCIRLFKREYGMSPQAFRKKMREEGSGK